MAEFFAARLRGRNEVPPVDSDAFGVAKFVADRRGTKIKFLLQVENIEDFIQAHIHFGAPNENGPVLAFLFGADLETLEEQEGITTRKGIVTGTLTDDDIVSNNVGIRDIEDLLELMRDGLTYVNAHTEQYPGGEIRGQITPLLGRK